MIDDGWFHASNGRRTRIRTWYGNCLVGAALARWRYPGGRFEFVRWPCAPFVHVYYLDPAGRRYTFQPDWDRPSPLPAWLSRWIYPGYIRRVCRVPARPGMFVIPAAGGPTP